MRSRKPTDHPKLCEIADQVEEAYRERGLPVTKMDYGMSYQAYYRIIHRCNVSVLTLVRICALVGLEVKITRKGETR